MSKSNWTSGLWRSRVSRRGVLRGAAVGVAGLSGAALIGCGDDDEPATPAEGGATGEPKHGGTLRVAMPQADTTLDPAFDLGSPDTAMTHAVYENLVQLQHDSTFKPMLAESLEPNADLTEYVAKLRPAVKFHHGKELAATDVVMTFERLLDPDVGSPGRASLSAIDRVEEVDPLTVRFVLNGPSAFLPDALSIYQAPIMPSDIDPSRYATEASGTGPLRMTEYRSGERTLFERNEGYWDEGLPYLDAVTFLFMPEPVTRLEALKTGSVDLLYPMEAAQVRGATSAGLTVSEQASGTYLNMAMRTDMAPFDDLRVRRAFQALTDRDFLLEAANYGYGVTGNDHSVPPFDPNFWEGQVQPGFDPEEAAKLLDGAGLKDLQVTLETSSISPGMDEVAVAFKELARAGGVTVDVRRSSEDGYWSNVWMVQPFTMVSWNGRSADEALSIVYQSDAPWNEAYYVNPKVDELLAKARGVADQQERTATYGEVEQILIDDVPRIVPVFSPTLIGMTQRVGGVRAHPNGWLLLRSAWLDA